MARCRVPSYRSGAHHATPGSLEASSVELASIGLGRGRRESPRVGDDGKSCQVDLWTPYLLAQALSAKVVPSATLYSASRCEIVGTSPVILSDPALLPIPRTRIIGREDARVTARLLLLDEAVPLLTLTGPGGVGKTRLALAVAAELRPAFADGIVWVDLAPLSDSSFVASALATVLEAQSSPAVEDELVRTLRRKQLLLLLDNCEHLIQSVAELVAALLGACPGLQVLATSRAPLRVRGEHELAVDPLPVPPVAPVADASDAADNEAVMLFLERARAVGSADALTVSQIGAVVEICRAVDGLPLAIELAAARTRIEYAHSVAGRDG